LQQFPGIAKFKDGPLQHEDLKTIMFEDIRNYGDEHWAPSSGAAPNSPEVEPDSDEDYDANEASDECEEVSPQPFKGKRPAPASRKDKGRKTKDFRRTLGVGSIEQTCFDEREEHRIM
jgi:hypothetical protein